jgi:hypothetical protein
MRAPGEDQSDHHLEHPPVGLGVGAFACPLDNFAHNGNPISQRTSSRVRSPARHASAIIGPMLLLEMSVSL